jgi:hypothetical protein
MLSFESFSKLRCKVAISAHGFGKISIPEDKSRTEVTETPTYSLTSSIPRPVPKLQE